MCWCASTRTRPARTPAVPQSLVVVFLSVFYLFPTALGTLGQRYVPDLLLTGQTDATVLLLPERMVGGSGVVSCSARW